MSECDLQLVILEMDDGVEGVRCHSVVKKILQTVLRRHFLAVVQNCQSSVEICVVLKLLLYKVFAERVVFKYRVVRLKFDECSAWFILSVVHDTGIRDKFSLFEFHASAFAVTVCAYSKLPRKCIYRFQTHTVKTY